MNDALPAPGAAESLVAAAAPPRPSLPELFIAYALISLYGFGGVLAWSRRMMVEERRWLTPEQFNEAYALCSFLPGPNIVNFSVIFGSRVRGPLGGLVALVGLLGPPVALIVVIGALYAHYGDLPALRADRRYRGGGRPDHVDGGEDGTAAVP
jgi:chromate transporter